MKNHNEILLGELDIVPGNPHAGTRHRAPTSVRAVMPTEVVPSRVPAIVYQGHLNIILSHDNKTRRNGIHLNNRIKQIHQTSCINKSIWECRTLFTKKLRGSTCHVVSTGGIF